MNLPATANNRSSKVTRLAISAAALAGVIVATACSGGNFSSTPPATVTAAISHFCITPSTIAQVAPIPVTGGFSGTLNIGASSATSSSCNVAVTVASGADVTTNDATRRAAAIRETLGTSQAPVLQISMDNAFTNNVEVTGATLNTPPVLSFPDGVYYGVVSSGTLPSTVLQFTAKNGVLTLTSTGMPIIIIPGTTATISLYGNGVIPQITSSPTPSPAANPTATPTAAPTATPTAMPTAAPTDPGEIIATSLTISPSTCQQFGYPATSITYTATAVTNAPPGTVFEYGWFTHPSFTVTVQPPTVDIGGVIFGFQNTALLNSPGFAGPGQFGESGENGEMDVYLYLAPVGSQEYPTGPVLFANGRPAIATALVDGGEITCPT